MGDSDDWVKSNDCIRLSNGFKSFRVKKFDRFGKVTDTTIVKMGHGGLKWRQRSRSQVILKLCSFISSV